MGASAFLLMLSDKPQEIYMLTGQKQFSSTNTKDQATAFLINKESTIYFEGVVL